MRQDRRGNTGVSTTNEVCDKKSNGIRRLHSSHSVKLVWCSHDAGGAQGDVLSRSGDFIAVAASCRLASEAESTWSQRGGAQAESVHPDTGRGGQYFQVCELDNHFRRALPRNSREKAVAPAHAAFGPHFVPEIRRAGTSSHTESPPQHSKTSTCRSWIFGFSGTLQESWAERLHILPVLLAAQHGSKPTDHSSLSQSTK